MSQFINGKDTIMIDGKGYGVGLVTIKRKADVLAEKKKLEDSLAEVRQKKDAQQEILNKMAKKVNKTMFKMSDEELQLWLYNRKRGFVIENKKGKGSYSRKNFKKGV